ncbi:MAG: CoA transferase [Catenulispora sp.]|nr:CoA transferase [Catenulispora sp.]
MTGPLSGLKVVELAGIGPAPFCGMFLADLGADVVRVDRRAGFGLTPVPPRLDLLNRGKRSIALDLKEPADLALALDLVARADVLLEGFRPGVAERLGIGPEACLARQPRLVYGRMTGWGQDGPRAQTAGHDLTYLAVSGVLHGIGRAGGPPQIPVNLLGDFAGGAMYLAAGVLAALWGGGGQVVDAAIVDGAAHLSTMLWGFLAGGAWRDRRGVNLLDSGAPFYDVYATADGQYMAVGPLEPQFFAEFLGRLGLPAEPSYLDPSSWPALRAALTTAFGTRTQAEWAEVFAGSDACVAPVLSLRAAAHDEHLASRGTYVEHDGVLQPAPAPRFSATPAALSRPPAEPDEHRDEILREWLGY